MPKNNSLHVSFDFPARLTVDAYDAFQKSLYDSIQVYGQENLTAIRYAAIHFTAATNAGLILNWNSFTMPSMFVTSEEQVDAFVVEWAGTQVALWIEERKTVPKVLSWRWLMLLIRRALPRRNSSRLNASAG